MTAGATFPRFRRPGTARTAVKLTGRRGFMPLRNQVDFAAPVAGGLGLPNVNFTEMAFQFPTEFRKTGPLKGLDHKIASGFEPTTGEFQCELPKMDRARLIGGLDARKVGGQVGNNKVDVAAFERRLQRRDDRLVAKIALD